MCPNRRAQHLDEKPGPAAVNLEGQNIRRVPRMSIAQSQNTSTAVLHLRPFRQVASRPAPDVLFTSAPRRHYEQGHIDALLLIISQLYGQLAEKDAEIKCLRQTTEELEGQLTYLQIRAIDLVAGWEG